MFNAISFEIQNVNIYTESFEIQNIDEFSQTLFILS